MIKVNKPVLAISVILIISFYACSSQLEIKDDDLTEKEYNVSGFDYVSMGLSGNLYYKQGDEYKVVVKAKQSFLNNLDVEVDGNKLKFKKRKPNIRNSGRVEIYVTSPNITGFSLSGSGNMVAKHTVNASHMDLIVSGSGNIEMADINMRTANIKISGSGSINIAGSDVVDECELKISGSGRISAKNIEIRNLDGHISGSGNGKFFVTDNLSARISGSGNIYYLGNPRLDVSISGSGRIKPLD